MTVREIREKYGLTQNQLSRITGIPVRTIGNWETGSRQPASYIPDMIQAMIEQKKEDYDMANFDLGLAKVKARERSEGAQADYLVYLRKNGIDWKDDSNPYVQNFNELWDMNPRIDKCENEDDINAILARISALRDLVK